jgi:hypothetical protein
MENKDQVLASQTEESKSAKSDNGKKKKIIIVIVTAVVAIAIAVVCYWYFQVKPPYDQAVNNYNAAAGNYKAAVSSLDEKNTELAKGIASLQAVIDSENPPLDEQLRVDAGATIGNAQGTKYDVPKMLKMPSKTEEINAAAVEINTLVTEIVGRGDYSEVMMAMEDAQSKLEDSIKKMSQVTNPSEQFVIERLTGLPNITGVQAVTEDHDPNGNLNKQSGYTATVYFSLDLIDQSSVDGNDIVDKGTDGGGAVEVYKTAEEAKSRNTYLGALDGGIFSSGSHTVCGTVIIRTSDNLKASQQQEMEKNIREALLRIE